MMSMHDRRVKLTKSVKDRIDELKSEIRKLEEEEKEENMLTNLSIEQQIAIQMHTSLCRANHIDVCGWHYMKDYDADVWINEVSHKRWLQFAEKLIAFCKKNDIPIEKAIEFVELVKEFH